MGRRAGLQLISAVTALVICQTAAPAEAGVVVVASCGVLLNTKARTERPSVPLTTASKSFVDLTGASLPVAIAGTAPSCLAVTFAARMLAVLPEGVAVRAVLDKTKIAEPGEIVMSANDDAGTMTAHAFTWVFTGVAPGNHVVKLQFRSLLGSSVGIGQSSLVVQYR
jgi:hypothetical protein